MEKGITFKNFRDMGGLALPDGGRIRAGKLFRTAVLAPKTSADKAYLENLGLDCVVDLRTDPEIRERRDRLPDGVEYVAATVFSDPKYTALAPTRASKLALLGSSSRDFSKIKGFVREAYALMPYMNNAYGEIFKRMNEGKTIAFHCTAGKDRTGVAAMLIELAFGRTAEQAKEEYLLSNVYRRESTEKLLGRLKKLRVPKSVTDIVTYSCLTHGELFDVAVEAIFSKYSDFGDFMREVYGVRPSDIEKWKEFYTE